MNSVQSFSFFVIFLVLSIGISEIHAKEPFQGCDCLKKNFATFFHALEEYASAYWKPNPKPSVEFKSESEQVKTEAELAVLVSSKIDIVVPAVKNYGFGNEVALGIVNLCNNINEDSKACSPYVKNIGKLLGNKLQEIYGGLSGVQMKQYVNFCGEASTSG